MAETDTRLSNMPRFLTLISAFSLIAALGLSGCVILEDDYGYYDHNVPQPTYGTCFADGDCEFDNFCQPMEVDFGDFVYENAICTQACIGDGPSVDCELGYTNEHGSCYSNDIVNQLDATPICFERCDTSGDCLEGFVCLNHLELPGLVVGDAICVPDPQ